jgi:hypothetical protein
VRAVDSNCESAMSSEHDLHVHRYAQLHHSTEISASEELTVPRDQATKCAHVFSRAGDSLEDTPTTMLVSASQATLITHLEKKSEDWVLSFTAEINGQADHGLRQKFALHISGASKGRNARDDPHSAISILEKYGS